MTVRHRWGRAIGTGLLAEVVIIGSIMVAIVVIKKVVGAGGMALAHSTASWTELIGGPLMIYFATRWVVRPLSGLHVPHALVLVGVAVALQLSIFWSTVAEGHAPLWIVALAVVLKIAAAVTAAVLAQRTVSPSS